MTNNKQQTAVDWLIDTIHNSQGMTQSDIDNVFERAKEMEKQQRSIELPSDEEIWDRADEIWGSADSEQSWVRHIAFMQGTKWMRYKIQGGEQ